MNKITINKVKYNSLYDFIGETFLKNLYNVKDFHDASIADNLNYKQYLFYPIIKKNDNLIISLYNSINVDEGEKEYIKPLQEIKYSDLVYYKKAKVLPLYISKKELDKSDSIDDLNEVDSSDYNPIQTTINKSKLDEDIIKKREEIRNSEEELRKENEILRKKREEELRKENEILRKREEESQKEKEILRKREEELQKEKEELRKKREEELRKKREEELQKEKETLRKNREEELPKDKETLRKNRMEELYKDKEMIRINIEEELQKNDTKDIEKSKKVKINGTNLTEITLHGRDVINKPINDFSYIDELKKIRKENGVNIPLDQSIIDTIKAMSETNMVELRSFNKIIESINKCSGMLLS